MIKKLIKELSYLTDEKDVILHEVWLLKDRPDLIIKLIKIIRDDKRKCLKHIENTIKKFF